MLTAPTTRPRDSAAGGAAVAGPANEVTLGTSTTELEEAIARILSPYLGETMARASVRGHCQRLGLLGSHLGDDQVSTLIQKIHAGLNVFVGRERSARIVEELMEVAKKLRQQP
jgi:hypothetical protein